MDNSAYTHSKRRDYVLRFFIYRLHCKLSYKILLILKKTLHSNGFWQRVVGNEILNLIVYFQFSIHTIKCLAIQYILTTMNNSVNVFLIFMYPTVHNDMTFVIMSLNEIRLFDKSFVYNII